MSWSFNFILPSKNRCFWYHCPLPHPQLPFFAWLNSDFFFLFRISTNGWVKIEWVATELWRHLRLPTNRCENHLAFKHLHLQQSSSLTKENLFIHSNWKDNKGQYLEIFDVLFRRQSKPRLRHFYEHWASLFEFWPSMSNWHFWSRECFIFKVNRYIILLCVPYTIIPLCVPYTIIPRFCSSLLKRFL